MVEGLKVLNDDDHDHDECFCPKKTIGARQIHMHCMLNRLGSVCVCILHTTLMRSSFLKHQLLCCRSLNNLEQP